jgi:hypothetical protein
MNRKNLFKMKFTVSIKELHDAYMEHKVGDSVFLCHFIKNQMISQRSLFHRFYFSLSFKPATYQFMTQLGELLNANPTTYLHEMVDPLPEFQDLAFDVNGEELISRYIDYRKAILKRILKLHPTATFTFYF